MKPLEIFLVLVLAVYAALTAVKWNEIGLIQKIFVIISIVTAFVIAFNTYTDWRKDNLIESVTKKMGEIKDKKQAVLSIEFGNSGTIFNWINKPIGGFIDKSGNPLFTIQVKDNKLVVYALIRNFEGKPIAVIDNNIWTVFSNHYEYNDDETSFELVTAGDRNIYFQLELKDGIAHFLGTIIDEDGNGRYWHQAEGIDGIFSDPINLNTKWHFPLNSNKTLFKYPREKYYGIRN